MDALDYFNLSFGSRLSMSESTEEQFEEKEEFEAEKRNKRIKTHHVFKEGRVRVISEPNPSIFLQAVVEPIGLTNEGKLIRSLWIPWEAIVRELADDWDKALLISPDNWEQLIAGAYDQAGYDEVTLTPRSGDLGRDIIAVKNGFGSVRILGSVKAYKPGHLVKHDDVRALLGVISSDQNATKGIFTTTSDFAPTIGKDQLIAPHIPHRLELVNGRSLQSWLNQLRVSQSKESTTPVSFH